MGAFSNVDYELQNNEAAVSNAFMEDDDMDMPQTVPAEPTTGSFPPDTELAPATAVSEPSAVSDTQSEDEARRAHEAAEAKRKAEWDAKQAEKRRAEQAALEKLDAMGPDELLKAAAKRVSADTEKLTRRNMKESVAEFIQTKCIDDLGFARLTMHPRKSMIHCFQYILIKWYFCIQFSDLCQFLICHSSKRRFQHRNEWNVLTKIIKYTQIVHHPSNFQSFKIPIC